MSPLRHALPALVAAGSSLASCQLLQPRLVSVTPEHGYVDGCTPLTIQGANLPDEVEVTIGGAAVIDLTPAAYDPDLPDHAQDVGFRFDALAPAAPGLEKGFQDVWLKAGDVEREIYQGYYFEACPSAVHAEDLGFDGAPAPGATMSIYGCGLDASRLTARFLAPDGTPGGTASVTPVCLTGLVTVTLPALGDGLWFVELERDDGEVWGGLCGGGGDSGGTGGTGLLDTADPCAGTFSFRIGAADSADTGGADTSGADTADTARPDSGGDTADSDTDLHTDTDALPDTGDTTATGDSTDTGGAP